MAYRTKIGESLVANVMSIKFSRSTIVLVLWSLCEITFFYPYLEYKCDKCYKIYRHMSNLARHKRQPHQSTAESERGEKRKNG